MRLTEEMASEFAVDREPGKAEELFRAMVEGGQGFLGLEPGRKGSEPYRTGQALSNLPALALPAAAIKGTGKAKDVFKSLTKKDIKEIASELETSRGQLAELVKKYPQLREASIADVAALTKGEDFPAFRGISLLPGRTLGKETTPSMTLEPRVALGMLRDAPVMMTKEGFITTTPVLRQYPGMKASETQVYVPSLIEQITERQPGALEMKIPTRSGEKMTVADIFKEVQGEKELLADVSKKDPRDILFNRYQGGIGDRYLMEVARKVLGGEWKGGEALVKEIGGYQTDPAALAKEFDDFAKSVSDTLLRKAQGGEVSTKDFIRKAQGGLVDDPDHRNSATTMGYDMATTSDELAEFNRMLKKQDDDARIDRYFQELNEAMADTIRDFRYGRAQAEDVQRFLPGHSEWDIHRRFGDTDESTNLRFPSAPPSFKRLEEFEPVPDPEIDDYSPDGRIRREAELQAKDGGFVDLTEKDLELLAQAGMGPLRVMGEGASNEYRSGLGGRVSYGKELDKDLALEAYLDGFVQKQKGEKATGDITGGGVRLIKRFEKGGLVDKKTSREMANTKFDQLFVESGQKYGVDPAILKAIASVESSFRPNVRGPRTKYGQAQGMMQFIPATAKAYGLDDPFDPAKSVDAAARLMRDNLKMFKGDVGKALEAYNGGPRLVGKSRQTAEYRDKVLQRSQYAGFGASPTQVAQQPAPETPISARPSPPARVGGERVGLSALSTLPMNYQAALALQYLTDTDPEGNPEEQAEQALFDLERSAEQETGPTVQQALASQQEALPSPFEAFKRRKPEKKGKTLPPLSAVMGFNKGGEARSDDLEDLATQMTFGTLPSDAKDSKAVKEGLKEAGRDVRRGIQLFAPDFIGGPVDILNLMMTPFGNNQGHMGLVEKPFMGSEHLIDMGVRAGLLEKPSGSGVETLTRMAGLPASALRGAMRAMQKGEEALGQGIDIARGKFPETAPEGAIKPRGGVIDPGLIQPKEPRLVAGQLVGGDSDAFLPGVANTVTQRGEPPQLSMTRVAAQMKERDGFGKPISPEHREALKDFINTKYAKYLKNEFGTEQDPLRQAFLAGEIFPPTHPGVEGRLYASLEDYLAANKRNQWAFGERQPEWAKLQAEDKKFELDRYYDAATNIQPTMLVRAKDLSPEALNLLDNDPSTYTAIKSAIGERLRSSGASDADIQDFYRRMPSSVGKDTPLSPEIRKLAENYADSVKINAEKMRAEGAKDAFAKLADSPDVKLLNEAEYAALDDTLKRSVGKELVFGMNEPSYLSELNADRILDTLAAVPKDKLSNMSFGQAFLDGNRRLSTLRAYDKGVADVLNNKSVPTEFLFTFTSPVAKTDNGQWVKFEDSRVNRVEGHLMKHSVGGYAESQAPYGLSGTGTGKQAFDSGDVEVFSLRDAKGKPMTTLESGRIYNSNKKQYVQQIQGKFNSAPTEYIKDVLELMKQKGLEFDPSRRLLSNNNEYRVDRNGNPLKVFDKNLGKEVINYDIIDWVGLKKAYDADPKNFKVIKIAKPEDTKNVLYNQTIYTTPERFKAANSQTGPGGFIERRARGGLVSMQQIHNWV